MIGLPLLNCLFLFLPISSDIPNLSNSKIDCPSCILSQRIMRDDKRYKSFLLILEMLKQRNAKVLVETGTARLGDRNCKGDGCSTMIFGDWAKQNDAVLYSVDIDPKAISAAITATRAFGEHVQPTCDDSVEYLEKFPAQIDFLYLDSYDFDFANPLPSQLHHKKEIIAAYPHLAENCIVMIDDCDLPHGGKGKYIIEYLLNLNWKIIYSGYQVILVRS